MRADRQVQILECISRAVQEELQQQKVATSAVGRVFMGGPNDVELKCSLNRCVWVAGEPVPVNMEVLNHTKKKVIYCLTSDC